MTTYIIARHEFELRHHGVKGMKWGVRRFQRKDGSLTPAGKKRYYDTPELNRQKTDVKSAKRARNIAYNEWNNSVTPRQYSINQKRFLAANAQYQHAKLKYQTNKEVARIRDKGIEFKKKSKHRLDLEEKYKKLGMTDEQAQAAANNRIKVERALAVTATIAVAGAAAYTARKLYKNRVDGIIKAGETLQRIEMQDTGGKLHDQFYVAAGKHDTKRYYNLLGATRQKQTGEAYVMKLMANKDVKVASRDRCLKVYREVMGGGTKADYDRFNQRLVSTAARNDPKVKAFYDRLKSMGYGAIQDVNDMKFSGYAAKNPLIVFDNSGGNIGVQSVKKITEDLSKKGSVELGKALGEQMAKEALETYGPVSVAALTATAAATRYTDPTKKHKKQGGKSKWR